MRWCLLSALALGLTACTAPSPQPVTLQPLGAVPPELLAHLRADLAPDYRLTLADSAPVPRDVWVAGRYDADRLLAKLPRPSGARWLLAVADLDCNTAERTFVFGLAEQDGQVAVVGYRRLASQCDAGTLRRRLEVTARHELGHLAGLAHCANPACVMYLSVTVADTDRKSTGRCRRCRAAAAQTQAPGPAVSVQ